MLRLLGLRAGALLLRPAAVLLEHLVVNGNAVVLVLPIAAIALIVSSIPVHRDYFRSHKGDADYVRLGREYASALTTVTVVSLAVLGLVLWLVPLGLSAVLAFATCFTFVVEKYADETSRSFEFRKAFVSWFMLQATRSGWLILPVAAYQLGAPYEPSFLAASALAAATMIFLFWRTTGLPPRVSAAGLSLIRSSSTFLVGNLLPAFYQQGPRILVPRLFPDQAHIYIALAQVCQGISLLFNVRFQIPYRKMAARRPVLFERRLRPSMRMLILTVLTICVLYLAVSFTWVGTAELTGLAFMAVLAPVLVGDALMFAIVTTYLGYIPWFVSTNRALTTYAFCLGCLAGLALALAGLHEAGLLRLLNLAPLFTILGFVWIQVVSARHFPSRGPVWRA